MCYMQHIKLLLRRDSMRVQRGRCGQWDWQGNGCWSWGKETPVLDTRALP